MRKFPSFVFVLSLPNIKISSEIPDLYLHLIKGTDEK